MQRFERPVLMWVTDRLRSDVPLPKLAEIASAGGVDIIQVRESGLDRLPAELLLRAIKTVAQPSTKIVINSDIGLARRMCVGVHLPEIGPTIAQAREALGPDALVGRSVHSAESAAASIGANYLIAGHVFETSSKPEREPLGLERLPEIVHVAPAPVLAIGGITPERVSSVIAAGAAGVAVMSPFTMLATVQQAVSDYRSALERTMTESATATITATINGKPVELVEGTTVSVFLAGRELHERLVVVERNGVILKRATFPEVVIEEGDLLEIVHFVGGG